MGKKINVKGLLDSQAGKLFAVSVLLFVVFLAGLGYAFYTDRMLGRTLLGAFIAHAVGGRGAGVALCIAFNMKWLNTVFYNMFLEVLIVSFCYALFLFSMTHSVKNRFIHKALLNAEKNALRYQEKIFRYGWLGVFLFVMVPLPATGPVSGSIIAYFLNFDLKRNFLCVFSGTFVAILLWAVFFDFLSAHQATIQGVFGVIGIVVMVYFAKYIWGWFSKEGLDQ